MYRIQLPFTATFTSTNLTNRNATKTSRSRLVLFFKANRPICKDYALETIPFNNPVTLTKPKGIYCALPVFTTYPSGEGTAAPNETYQVVATGFSGSNSEAAPDQTTVYRIDGAPLAQEVLAEISKGPDFMAILSPMTQSPNGCAMSIYSDVASFVASTETYPIDCQFPGR
jgi:hypothetical protein